MQIVIFELMDYTIRKAGESDFQGLERLWRSQGIYSAPWDNVAHLPRKLEYQPDLMPVAARNNHLNGAVTGTFDRWAATVNHWAVAAGDDAGKIREALLREIHKRLRKRGARAVFAVAFPHGEEHAFLRSQGYREWGLSVGLEKSLSPTDRTAA